MREQFKEYVRNCNICNKNKCDRLPKQEPIGNTTIPNKGGNRYISIFYAHNFKNLL